MLYMNQDLSFQGIYENQELTKDLFVKYDFQLASTESLVQKYHVSSKRLQKVIYKILKERGFDRNDIESLFQQ